MDDHELRSYLNRYQISIGPVIGKTFSKTIVPPTNKNQGHTRTIYQQQLLRAIDQEINKGNSFLISSTTSNLCYSDVETKMEENNDKLREFSMDVEDGLVTRSGRVIHRYPQ